MTDSTGAASLELPKDGYIWIEGPNEYRPSNANGERWRWAPGWDYFYLVSSHGDVSSQARVIVDRRGGSRKTTTRLLTPALNGAGYQTVILTDRDRKEGTTVHRLVARTFLPNEGGLPFVNHMDGNRQNNRLDNLEWIDGVGNARHARDSQRSRAGLSVADVRAILIYRREVISEVAAQFKVKEATIRDIFAGRTWRDLKEQEPREAMQDGPSHVSQN